MIVEEEVVVLVAVVAVVAVVVLRPTIPHPAVVVVVARLMARAVLRVVSTWSLVVELWDCPVRLAIC